MRWLLTSALCVLLVEIAVRLPLIKFAKQAAGIALRAMRVLRKKTVSDHWKEKAILAYSRRLFVATLALTGLMAGVVGAAVLATYLLDALGTGIGAFVLSGTGVGFSLLIATLYYVARMHRG